MVCRAPLGDIAESLRWGRTAVFDYINESCDRVEAVDPHVRAFLPEEDRRSRLLHQAELLEGKFADSLRRPSLYGVLVGVKDVFRTDTLPTKAGSQLPSMLFDGPQASCVSRLLAAGALILGKTVTTEFAYFEPGPTRNPHNLGHTPGGSSSGSAAAVAAGMCPLALGTQTLGSVIRPAAFCGVVGFKPSLGRIPNDGIIYFSPSLDQIGIFTQDVEGALLASSILCDDWSEDIHPGENPVLGVPEGPYLDQASQEALRMFEAQLDLLGSAGYRIRRLRCFHDLESIHQRHWIICAGELARVHEEWVKMYEPLYSRRTLDLIYRGSEVSSSLLERSLREVAQLRARVEDKMAQNGIDLWVAPAAPGPAPSGLDSTGDPCMNIVWTQAGLPALTLPAGRSKDGLPLGIQLVARHMADERLLLWAEGVAGTLKGLD